jgi:putative glycosyltransferase (TIGR04372 family)
MINFILRQYKQFKKNRLLYVKLKFRILISEIIIAPFYILLSPFFFIILLIRPILLIRFGKLESNRIGHLAGNTEIHILEKRKIDKNKFMLDIYFAPYYPICNKYLLDLWSRYITILPKFFVKPFFTFFSVLFNTSPHIITFHNKDRDVNNLLDNTKSVVSFEKNEIRIGENFLKKLNPKNKKIVCFIIRDNAYLKEHLPLSDMSYHNYRNFSLDNYIPALKMLIDLDYFVIRMGSAASSKINFSNKNLIDLPFSEYRTEFLDIYLGYKCDFVMTTSTGWDAVPGIMFRKPMLICPMIPLGNLFTFSSKYMLTTLNFVNSENEKITQSDIFKLGYANAFESKDYIKSDFQAIEHSSNDICLAVRDFIEYLNNKDLDLVNNDVFWNLYIKNIHKYNLNHLHGDIKAIMSPSFLENNKNLLR